MRSEQSNEPSTEQFDEVDHPGNATALLRLCQPGSDFRKAQVEYDAKRRLIVKGAPEDLLRLCARYEDAGGLERPLDAEFSPDLRGHP